MKRFNAKSGFTLVESIVAAMILSLAVIALSGICTKSISAVRSSREREQAWEVLDKQMQLLDYEGLESLEESNGLTGINEDYKIPYSWRINSESLESGLLYEVTVNVSWKENAAIRNISASTRLNEDGDIGTEDSVMQEGQEEGVTSQSGSRGEGQGAQGGRSGDTQ